MQDPFDSGIAVGKIVCTGAAVDRHKVISGEHLPMENANGYLIRASQRRVLGRHEDAIADYNRALELDPSNGDVQFKKGLAYVALGNKEAAIAAFEAAILLFQRAASSREAAAQHWIDQLQSGS
jgi:tetratricopeptide (TPR) repeat protein